MHPVFCHVIGGPLGGLMYVLVWENTAWVQDCLTCRQSRLSWLCPSGFTSCSSSSLLPLVMPSFPTSYIVQMFRQVTILLFLLLGCQKGGSGGEGGGGAVGLAQAFTATRHFQVVVLPPPSLVALKLINNWFIKIEQKKINFGNFILFYVLNE